MFTDEWSRSAAKDYRDLPTEIQDRIDEALNELRADPLAASNVKPLHGKFSGLFRKRVGDYRLFFRLDHARKLIQVAALRHRQGAY